MKNDLYRYSKLKKGIRIDKYIGAEKDVIIPEIIDGEPVTRIGSCAFSGCSSLTSITIPSSVTNIGDNAFEGCSSLTSITIPNIVTSIGWYTFNKCRSLTSITIPEGVTSIGYYAFEDCSSLTSIDIPSSVTSIGYCAFYNCRRLTSMTISSVDINIEETALGGCKNLIVYLKASKYKEKLFSSTKDVVCDVKSIGKTGNFEWVLFNNDTIGISNYVGDSKDVVIPEQINGNLVVEICNFAFQYSNIENLILPDTVVYVDRKALNNCKGLKEIKAPKGVKINASCTVEYVEVSYENKIEFVEKYFKKKLLKDEFILDLIGYVNENYEKFDKDILAKFYKLLKNRKKDLIANLKIIEIEKRLQDISEDIKPDFVYEGNKLVGVNDKVNIIKLPDNCEIDLNAFAKCKAKKIKVADTNNSLTAEFLSKAVLSDTIEEFEISCDSLIKIDGISNTKISKQIQNILTLTKVDKVTNSVILSKIIANLDDIYTNNKVLQKCTLSNDDIEVLMAIPIPNEVSEESCNQISLTAGQSNMLAIEVSKYLELDTRLENIVFAKTGNKVPYEAMLLIAFKIIHSQIDIDSSLFYLYNLINVDSIAQYTSKNRKGLVFSSLEAVGPSLTEVRKLQRSGWSRRNKGDDIESYISINNNIDVMIHMLHRNLYMDFNRDDVTEIELINILLKIRPISLDDNGEKIYDYGDKQIKVKLLSNTKIKITDLTNNKILRSMPKASKKEDATIVENILQDFEQTQKMVANVKTYYEKELRLMFENNKSIDVKNFNKQFENIVTSTIMAGVLWGIYDESGNLLKPFRVISKDNYVDINGDNVTLDSNALLSTVDAGEIPLQEVLTWKKILWGDEKPQLIRQFEAPIHYVPLDKLKERYLGRNLSSPGCFKTDYIILDTKQKNINDKSKEVKEVRGPLTYIGDIKNLSDKFKRLLNRSIIKADKAVNIEKSVEDLVVIGDLQGIKTAKETAIITADNIAHFTNMAIKQENAEVTAYLMELKKDMIGDIVDLDWEI